MKCAEHPAQYLAKLKVGSVDVRRQISAISDLPYPYDPLLEPELAGMTYYQVALLKQAQAAAAGALEPLVFFTDRRIGKPAQVNFNLNSNESYAEFLKRIARAEGEVVDEEPDNELGL